MENFYVNKCVSQFLDFVIKSHDEIVDFVI